MRSADELLIVDYEAGNLRSVELAVAHLGRAAVTSDDPERVRRARRVIFPGVGGADAAMAVLRGRGLDDALREVHRAGRPMLGICVGCQVVFDSSEEGPTDCLGLLPGRVTRLLPAPGRKVPHMGWNVVRQRRAHPVVAGIADGARFYFVHSFSVTPGAAEVTVGATWYGREFAAIVAAGNIVATQFHAEKSGHWGLRLLGNFLSWSP
jgi:glutamine amidotransferase